MSENKKPFGKMKIFLIIVLVLILAVGAAVIYYTNSVLNKINRVEQVQETLSDEEIQLILQETDPAGEDFTGVVLDPEEITLSTEPAQLIEQKETVYNILLIGQDRRPDQGRQRSDAMILCTVNTEKKTLVMTSFMRDTYVNFPEYNGKTYYNNRLNVPYAIGGMEMLDDCLKLNFGVEVDHNIEVDFSGFEKIIDAMGGVDMELTGSEAYIVGVRTGMNRLNGKQALEYARIRQLDNDFGRTNRQRKVIAALLEQVRNLSMTELLELTDVIFPMITTDMTNADIINYVTEFFPILTELEVTSQSVPGDGEYYFAQVNGMSVLMPDMEKISQKLTETIGS